MAQELTILEKKRHSLAHLLASAILEMFPDAQLGVGPVIENGFFYDFLLPRTLTPEDLPQLQKRMVELANEKLDFLRDEKSFGEAIQYFQSISQPFKVELVQDLEKSGEVPNVSLYQTGKFIDLCRGGHVENTAEIDPASFCLDKISGAYWRGDQNNPQMQRIYGLAFESAAELQKYLQLREELEKRDHRIIGPQLKMFSFHEFAPGIPFYEPNGTIVRNQLEKFVREVSYGEGYKEVRFPQIFDAELFKISGHWDHYKDDMFTLESEGRTFGIKPMNCPGHMLYYKQGLYSYRDLPLRLAEITTLYRNELSGTLSGLTRVRALAQDDTHIFVTPSQITEEISTLLQKIQAVYSVFNMSIEQVTLATRPEQSLGTAEDWEFAENSLKLALEQTGWEYEIEPGDGAFYGPKIDMRIKDVLGRYWQLATIQLDFQMPLRFGLEYVDSDGKRKPPIVIHRAILGSFERFMAILLEQYAGELPVWLHPTQVAVLPISENHQSYAHEIQEQLKNIIPDLRIEMDLTKESIGKKIREQSKMKVPYILVIGDKEAESGTISVRTRNEETTSDIQISIWLEQLKKEIQNRNN